jgi:hypothetical protein
VTVVGVGGQGAAWVDAVDSDDGDEDGDWDDEGGGEAGGASETPSATASSATFNGAAGLGVGSAADGAGGGGGGDGGGGGAGEGKDWKALRAQWFAIGATEAEAARALRWKTWSTHPVLSAGTLEETVVEDVGLEQEERFRRTLRKRKSHSALKGFTVNSVCVWRDSYVCFTTLRNEHIHPCLPLPI